MESNECLPSLATLSSTDLSFLDERLRETLDLAGAPAIVSELQLRCEDLDKALIDLNLNLQSALLAYASFSDGFHDLSVDASSNLTDLTELTRSQRVVSGGEEECRKEKILGEELPALAKEVARVETVRAYAETALRLDTLVGDVEDAVSAAMSTTLRRNSSARSSNEKQLVAIQKLGQTEDVLTSITKKHPQWTRLVLAVDNRLDRALTILRPQAIADHRALLSSLGWPPPLSILSSANLDTGKSTEVPNPLFTMHGDLKHQYCENFLNLCRLQEVQTRRKSRQLEGHYREVALHQPLWAIEELVNPIALACQKHFSTWIEKPEFIFALGYKITRDYVDTMDELLQPLVDEARLVGYSCREEWIAAMVSSLCTYLAKEVFPIYIGQLEDVTNTDVQGQARISWLNVVDLMIAFDKRIQPLATHSGILNTLQEDENLQKISSLSVFSDRPDWLNIWVQLELNDTLKKLKHEIENERNWKMKSKQADLLTGSENYKSPSVSSACLRCLSLVVERCRSLPTRSMRSRLLRGAGAPIIQKFLDSVLLRCQEAEGLTALTDDDSLVKVAECVNAVHHVESVLKEWCEDIFFLEMGSDHDDSWGTFTLNSSDRMEAHDGSNAILDGEVKKLEEFRNEWVEKIAVVILRGFDARSRDYVNNRKQWQEKSEEGAVSKTLLGALDYLQAKMTVVEENLNQMDFVCVWRSLAAGIDRLILSGILIRNVKFNDNGVERFSKDLEVVFGVFGAWCIRPEGFFRKTTEGLKLLKMGKRQQQDGLAGGTEWTKKNGIRHLSVAEAGKILNGRVFAS